MKLTDKQREIIALMQAGWELQSTKSEDGTRACVQNKVMAGKAYRVDNVKTNTLTSLLKGGMIEVNHDRVDLKNRGHFTYYQLTDKGKR